MILFSLLFCVGIPVLMWYIGRTFRNRAIPFKKNKGIRYFSKRARSSEQAWRFANHLYFHILWTSGMNTAAVSAFLCIFIYLKYTELVWLFCFVIVIIQAAAGFLLPVLVTETILRKSFDTEGRFTEDPDDAGSEEEKQDI